MTLYVKYHETGPTPGHFGESMGEASPADVLRWQGWEDCDCENGRQFEYTPGDLGTRSWPCNQCAYGLVPPDWMTEAAAGASWEAWWGGKREPWKLAVQRRPKDELDLYRESARAALVAAARKEKP